VIFGFLTNQQVAMHPMEALEAERWQKSKKLSNQFSRAMASPFLAVHPTSGGFISILLSKLERETFFIGRQKTGRQGSKVKGKWR